VGVDRLGVVVADPLDAGGVVGLDVNRVTPFVVCSLPVS
jgi:hypothetical protein